MVFQIISFIFLIVALILPKDLFAAPSLDGVFEGAMHLTDDNNERDIPLAFNLKLTGEVVKVADGDELFEEQRVIEGAFVVDEEGGPFAFASVRYQLEKNQIDLRYIRPENNLKPSASISYHLLGKLNSDNSISGEVISGIHGPIGTFKVQKTKKTGLTVIKKYEGTWGGYLLRPDGTKNYINIIVSSARGVPTTNPREFELEYTTGKLGNLLIQTVAIGFNYIVVDYFRRRMLLNELGSSGRASISFESMIDFKAGTMTGHSDGILKGRTGTYVLKKIK